MINALFVLLQIFPLSPLALAQMGSPNIATSCEGLKSWDKTVLIDAVVCTAERTPLGKVNLTIQHPRSWKGYCSTLPKINFAIKNSLFNLKTLSFIHVGEGSGYRTSPSEVAVRFNGAARSRLAKIETRAAVTFVPLSRPRADAGVRLIDSNGAVTEIGWNLWTKDPYEFKCKIVPFAISE